MALVPGSAGEIRHPTRPFGAFFEDLLVGAV